MITRRLQALGALGVFVALLAVSTAHAQDAVPDQNIRLPSVNEYSLPPGDNSSPATDPAQGPVDEEIPPPTSVRPATQPAQTARPNGTTPNGSAGTATPTQRSPATGTRPTANPATSAPRPATQTRGPARPAPTVPREAAPTVTPTPAPQTPAANDNAVEASASDDALSEGASSEETSVATTSDDTADTSAETVSSTVSSLPIVPIGLVLGALLAALAGFYFWKRRSGDRLKQGDEFPEDESVAVKEAPAIEPKPVTASKPDIATPRKPAPKIYSPPNPAKEPEAAPVSNNGFITTKVGLAPKAPAPAVQSPVQIKPPPPAIKQPGDLTIEFVADKASSTLMNAIVGYQIAITNEGKETAQDLKIFADLVQADQKDALHSPVNRDVAAHEIEALESGETIKLSGDIRLPLSLIQPISVNRQALFVPLARFNIDYATDKQDNLSQSASYIVGREHEPPTPKMAPFRLDLGPRNFGPVGQRPVQI